MTLAPMSAKEFVLYQAYLIRDMSKFNEQQDGVEMPGAFEKAHFDFAALLPKGQATKNNYFFDITVDQQRLGRLWVEQSVRNGVRILFIHDIVIFHGMRRLGYGTQAMKLVEEMLCSDCSRIGLRVDCSKPENEAFYRKLGYVPVITHMQKFI